MPGRASIVADRSSASGPSGSSTQSCRQHHVSVHRRAARSVSTCSRAAPGRQSSGSRDQSQGRWRRSERDGPRRQMTVRWPEQRNGSTQRLLDRTVARVVLDPDLSRTEGSRVRVGHAVAADSVPLLGDPPQERGEALGVLPDAEEGRPHVELVEHVQHAVGAARHRPVVEGQRDAVDAEARRGAGRTGQEAPPRVEVLPAALSRTREAKRLDIGDRLARLERTARRHRRSGCERSLRSGSAARNARTATTTGYWSSTTSSTRPDSSEVESPCRKAVAARAFPY